MPGTASHLAGQAKILGIGTLLLLGGLALYAVPGRPIEFRIGVWLCVDAGLLLIGIVSMGVAPPSTLQYVREQVASALSEIIHDKAGQDDGEPAEADRQSAEEPYRRR